MLNWLALKIDRGDIEGNFVDCDGYRPWEVDGDEALAGVFHVFEDGEGGDADCELLKDVVFVVRSAGRLSPRHLADLKFRAEKLRRRDEPLMTDWRNDDDKWMENGSCDYQLECG